MQVPPKSQEDYQAACKKQLLALLEWLEGKNSIQF